MPIVDGRSLLLDLDGLVVESVQRLEDGTRLVCVLTAPQWVGICPDCGERSTQVEGLGTDLAARCSGRIGSSSAALA